MSPEEKVLSQADIDALVAKVPPKPPAPKPAAPAVAPVIAALPDPVPVEAPKPAAAIPQPVPASLREGTARYEKYTSIEVSNMQNTVADLARQVAKMTNMMQRLEDAEGKVSQIYSLLRLDPAATETLGERLDGIYARIEELARHYSDYQNEFQCRHCKSKQMMALHVKCTSCGEEAWMGWWPEGNRS